MRTTATCLLAALIVLLVTCVAWQAAHPWLAWPRAFAEAGTVGAIADWYAVVALFRYPCGMPIPHTAIIPKNQQRIAESLGSFVEENFLTPEVIVGRLSGFNAAEALAGWLAVRENSAVIAEAVAGSLPRLLDDVDETDVEHFFDRIVVPRLRRFEVSRMAGQVLDVLTEGNRHQPLLDRGLSAVETWLSTNVDLIKAKFSEASKFTPAPLGTYIVNKFVESIVALIREVVANPAHELRRRFDVAVQDLSGNLRTSVVYRRFGRLLLRDCIRHLEDGRYYRALLDRVREHVLADLGSERSAVRDMIAGTFVAIGKGVASESSIQRKLNAWWLDIANLLVLRHRHQLSALITDVVKGWDAKEVSRKLEAEIGRDLQYIRINGTFVGGTVGVLIHACVLLFLW
ncbi:membrane protein [Paraburkholderia caffeinilytica]|nr:membrane protein [Paraburkholderia caffeinilytica]